MITVEQAFARISDLSPEEVRELSRRRLVAEDTAPVAEGYLDEPLEDLVIRLLHKKDLAQEIRQAVIAGCKDVYSRLLAWLAAADRPKTDADLEKAAIRLCRVVDVAEPSELRSHADAVLSVATDLADLPSGVLSAAVRGSMPFGNTPSHIPLWERVLQHPQVAAYGFNALLEIDPHHSRIEAALVDLWLRRLREHCNVDVASLMRRAAQKRRSETIIAEVLSTLVTEVDALPQADTLWENLRQELLRRDWSRKWAELTVQRAPVLFVAMQFSEAFDRLYSDVIKPSATRTGFRVVRMDDLSSPGIGDIENLISEASLVLADITSHNPNVMWELGYAEALKKPIILLAPKGEQLPFGIRTHRVIFYEDTLGGGAAIRKMLEEYLQNPVGSASPPAFGARRPMGSSPTGRGLEK